MSIWHRATQRELKTCARDDPGTSVKSEPGSTQPEMPRALMRRQVPLDSPSCTREFGPIDATRRDCLLGPARTTTQPLEIEVTQRGEPLAFGAGRGVAVGGGVWMLAGGAADGAATA